MPRCTKIVLADIALFCINWQTLWLFCLTLYHDKANAACCRWGCETAAVATIYRQHEAIKTHTLSSNIASAAYSKDTFALYLAQIRNTQIQLAAITEASDQRSKHCDPAPAQSRGRAAARHYTRYICYFLQDTPDINGKSTICLLSDPMT